MKKIFSTICLATALAALASCGGKHESTIGGHLAVPGSDNMTVYLYSGNHAVDSATVANNAFAITVGADSTWLGTLYVVSAEGRMLAMQPVVVEEGVATVDFGDDFATVTLGGTPLNDSLQALSASLECPELDEQLQVYLSLYYAALNPDERAEAEHLYDSVDALRGQHLSAAAWRCYNRHRADLVGAYAMEVIANNSDFTFSQFDSILAQATPVVARHQPVAAKLELLRRIEATSAGHRYTDIQGVDGRLSDLVDGRLALVDFWASWCGPCRAEIKDNLVPLYAKYKDRGLTIVGLNVWERGDRASREAAHAKAVESLGIAYPQLVDSTRTATDTYGVQGIPQILLIGPDGTILARDLRGAAIEEAVLQHLPRQ